MEKNLKFGSGSVPMGTIVAFALNEASVPSGWIMCDGRVIPAQYHSLITALGSTTTPNLCGRTLIGTGKPNNGQQDDGRTPNFDPANNWPLAFTGGEYSHKLTISEIPAHSHTINQGNFGVHGGSFQGKSDDDLPFENSGYEYPVRGTDATGGDGLHNTMQPYYAVNYIIYTGN